MSRGGAFSRGGARGSVSRGSARRVPVSRGGGGRRGGAQYVPQESQDVEALGVGRQTSRGRLQVIGDPHCKVQRFEEEETEM